MSVYYRRFKTTFMSSEKESPFLEELHDDSVVREMERWNFDNEPNELCEASALEEHLHLETNKHDSSKAKHECQNSDCTSIKSKNRMRQNSGHSEMVLVIKVIILMFCVTAIIFIVMCSEDQAYIDKCGRPGTASFLIVVLFASIAFNLLILSFCQRYRICGGPSQNEAFYHATWLSLCTLSLVLFIFWFLSGTRKPWDLMTANVTTSIDENYAQNLGRSEHNGVWRDTEKTLDVANKDVAKHRNPCDTYPLTWRRFGYGVASISLVVLITAFHLVALSLFLLPCVKGVGRVFFDEGFVGHCPESHPIKTNNCNNNNNNSHADVESSAKKKSPDNSSKEPHKGMVTRPLILKSQNPQFVTSSPVTTPTKNQSLLRKVANANLWGSKTKNGRGFVPVDDEKDRGQLNTSIVSAEQLLESSLDESFRGSDVAVVGVNTSIDDVVFDANDGALLRAVINEEKGEDNEVDAKSHVMRGNVE